MSIVVCKVSKDKIEMTSDSIAVKGWTKINNAQKCAFVCEPIVCESISR